MAQKGGVNMQRPKGETEFMIDYETKTAHFWADNKEDMKTMLNMHMVNLAIGGYKIKAHTVSDVKPEIFDEIERKERGDA